MRTDPANRTASRSIASEVVAVILIAIAIILLLSLATYSAKDASWNSIGPDHAPSNLIGRLGAHLSDVLLQLFGLASFTLPLILIAIGLRAIFVGGPGLPVRKAAGSLLLLIALSGLLSVLPEMSLGLLANSRNGGAVGYLVEGMLAHMMNAAGAAIVLAAVSLLTLMLAMDVTLASIFGFAAAATHAVRVRLGGDQPVRTVKPQPAGSSGPGPIAVLFSKIGDRLRSRRQRVRPAGGSTLPPRESIQTESARRPLTARTSGVLAAPGPSASSEVGQANGSNGRAVPVFDDDQYPQPDINPFPEEEPAISALAKPAETVRGRGSVRQRESLTAEKYSPRPAPVEREAIPLASGIPQTQSVTMDPDVAEMISTASIVRSLTDPDAVGATAAADRTTVTVRQKSKPAQKPSAFGGYSLPPLDLLETPITHKQQAEEELRDRATVLAEKCKEFSVTGHIHRINPGPVVTTFEFKPDPGVKYSRVVSLGDDLCLALKAESIRIDRIPGKSTVGIEVPNALREKIYLRDVVESPKFQNSESKLTIALGKTINGDEYAADLMKMPHLLIAGATGAGKSVTLNAIICSILYKASPEEVKFIMVDPKRLELGLYEGIPHLLTPIVTEPKRAANALKWATNEMENRYRELAKVGVRNIDQFNQHVRETTHPTISPDDPTALKPLPYIIITIDELADLMMVARGDVETSIARLAQMARAVGIHLVVATQRPSVDVITGVIKANFPSRIAFRVSSKVDSRTIIDSNGAEGLLGQGDMLFLPPASSRLIRVHGSFVNEAEIKRITDHTRNQAKPDYNEQVTQSEQEAEGFDEGMGEQDDLFDDALAIVTDMGRASTSVLQRRLSIGYGRAAKILDIMEKGGFIGPGEGSKPRKVLSAAYEFRDRVQQRLEERAE